MKHPALPIPAFAADPARREETLAALAARKKAIDGEKRDPFRHVWLSPTWVFSISLLGLDHLVAAVLAPFTAADVRRRLTFSNPVKFLFFMGGNRSGKTELGSFLTNHILASADDRRAWCFQETEKSSIQQQQPPVYKYMPAEMKTDKPVRTKKAYIAYSQQQGFGPGGFVFPNGSQCDFRNYSQDPRTVEGGEIDLGWMDELASVRLWSTMRYRVATRNGILLNTFTCIEGYTPLVATALDGAETVLSAPAFLLPTDGGATDIPRALGFTDEQDFSASATLGPESYGFRLKEWLAGGSLHPDVPSGRSFEMLPVVAKRHDLNAAVVFSPSNNNPYGNPRAIIANTVLSNREEVRRRFYGFSTKAITTAFPLFSRKVHVVPAASIPAAGENDMVCDPGPGTRNYFMIWARVTPLGTYIYREWPGHYEVPTHGIPGAWAVPSDDPRKFDGDPGPAQRSFGFGTLGYKKEIARLEGWKDYRADLSVTLNQTQDQKRSIREQITAWTPENGAREKIRLRLMDSRLGSSVVTTADGVVEYFASYDEIGLHFTGTAGKRSDGKNETETGLGRLNDLLEYDPTQPVDIHNRPRLFISDACLNCITALETYTGADGQRGAWKDVVDVIRYLAQADLEYVPPEKLKPTQGQGL